MKPANPKEQMKGELLLWAKWRRSQSHLSDLDYPSQTAEQERIGGSNKSLPDWEIEMRLDYIIEQKMPQEWRRIIFAAFAIPQSLKSLEDNKIFVSGMEHNKKRNIYFFPATIDVTARKCLGLPTPTYYNLLKCAKSWLQGKEYS